MLDHVVVVEYGTSPEYVTILFLHVVVTNVKATVTLFTHVTYDFCCPGMYT